ncbi:MAG: hypothetical protein QME48_01205 [bacterium]|nr:hypothetical protein [bacterium]
MKRVFLVIIFLLFSLLLFSQNFVGIKIFVLDNDSGLKLPDPDNVQVQIGYEENLLQSFSLLGFSVDSNNLRVGYQLPSYPDILEYGAVFIVCGHRPVSPNILSSNDIENLKNYLDYGGCVYIEGNNIADFLNNYDSEFLNQYFNNYLFYNGGSQYSYIETIFTDTLSTFCRQYKFLYPAGTPPDYSIDNLGNFHGLGEPYYFPFFVFEEKGKLYRSTATAYTPPESKGILYFPGRTVMSTTDFSAYSCPLQGIKSIPDSTKNILMRTSYLRDILKFFGIGRTLVLDDNGLEEKGTLDLLKVLDENKIDYTYLNLKNTESYPNYDFLSKFTTVILYTGEMGEPFILPDDTFNLQRYLTFGGNMIVSGENLAQSYGVPGVNSQKDEFPFLSYYMWVDYRSSSYDDVYFSADKFSIYASNEYTAVIKQIEQTKSNVDDVYPFPRDTFVNVNYYLGLPKASVIVGVNNIATTHRSVFFGFPFEYLDSRNLNALINVTFTKFFKYDLTFTTLRTVENNTKNVEVKEVKKGTRILYSNDKIYIENANSAKLIDCLGNTIKVLSNGENYIGDISKKGVFFVIYKDNDNLLRTYKFFRM